MSDSKVDVGSSELSRGWFQARLTQFTIKNSFSSADMRALLEPFRSTSQPPLGFFEERCLKCGSILLPYGNRNNKLSDKKKWVCPICRTYTTRGFDRGAHVPLWVYDEVLFGMAKSYRNEDIRLEVKKTSKDKGPPSYVSDPTMYRIANSCVSILDKFEPKALRWLSTKTVDGTWCMDDRFNDMPFDQSLFPDKILDLRRGKPHMYPTVVIHEETDYCFSSCVSRKRDKSVAMRALALALDRAGVQPLRLKIDKAKGLDAAALSLLPPERISCTSKDDDFSFNNPVEMWFSHYGLRHNKHHCQYKRVWTQECSLNIYRCYRNYIWPFKKTGKTPAESLGLALPRNINNKISFIPLLDFADRLNNFVESEIALMKNRDF